MRRKVRQTPSRAVGEPAQKNNWTCEHQGDPDQEEWIWKAGVEWRAPGVPVNVKKNVDGECGDGFQGAVVHGEDLWVGRRVKLNAAAMPGLGLSAGVDVGGGPLVGLSSRRHSGDALLGGRCFAPLRQGGSGAEAGDPRWRISALDRPVLRPCWCGGVGKGSAGVVLGASARAPPRHWVARLRAHEVVIQVAPGSSLTARLGRHAVPGHDARPMAWRTLCARV